VLLGVGERIATAVRGRNVDDSPTRFLLDPRDHIEARRQARAAHQDVLGFYHSHPATRAQPSDADVAEWTYPEALTLIVGMEQARLHARAFRLRAGRVEEVELEVDCD
jgi:proteasome lid subunit RPN8/RPN11